MVTEIELVIVCRTNGVSAQRTYNVDPTEVDPLIELLQKMERYGKVRRITTTSPLTKESE